MKVLLLSQHFWPESFRINEVAQSLIEQGCEVTVLTGKPNYPEGRIYVGYRIWGVQRESRQDLCIVRVPLWPRGSGSGLRLVLNYLSFIASTVVLGPWALRGQRFDVIFVYGTSPILQVLGAIALKRIKGVPLVTWVQDFWPDSLQVTGFVTNRIVLNAVAALVRWIYRRNNLLLAQSPGFVEPLRAMAGGTPVVYHPNPASRFDPAATDAVSGDTALRLKPGFNIVFAGNLGHAQALNQVLLAAELLGPKSGIRWTLIGSGACSTALAEQVHTRGLSDRVELPGRFEPAQMPAIFEQADALLVSLRNNPATSRTVPSKVQTYLTVGRPILAALDGEGAELIRQSGAGICCAAEDSRALSDAALALRDLSAAERQRMALAGQRYAREHFSPELLARRLIEHFVNVGQPLNH